MNRRPRDRPIRVILVGLLLVRRSWTARQSHGLTGPATVGLDRRRLYLLRYDLSVRSDRLGRDGELIVPEEQRSALRIDPSARDQLAD